MHGVGQAPFGHLLGLTGQRPQRLGDRPRHQPRHHTGDDDRRERQDGEPPLAGLGGGLQLVGAVGQGVGDLLAEDRVAVGLGILAGGVGDQRLEVGVARLQRGVDRLGEPDDLGRGEQVDGELPVLAGRLGVDEVLVGPQLAQRGCDRRDLLRGVDAVRGLASDVGDQQVAHEDGDEVGLVAAEVDELGPASQLGVVDRQRDPLVGGEQVVHHHRVAVEVLGHGVDVEQAAFARVGVDLGPEGVELVQLVEGRLVCRLDGAPQALHLVAELGDGLVGHGPRLGVVLDREGEGVDRVEQVDRRCVALVLEVAEQADRADGRLGEGPLLTRLVRVARRLHHLEHGHHDEGDQRHGQRAGELHADRDPAHSGSVGRGGQVPVPDTMSPRRRRPEATPAGRVDPSSRGKRLHHRGRGRVDVTLSAWRSTHRTLSSAGASNGRGAPEGAELSCRCDSSRPRCTPAVKLVRKL